MDTHTESPRSESAVPPIAASRRHSIGMFVAAAAGLCTGSLTRTPRARPSSDRLPHRDGRMAGNHYGDCGAVLYRLRVGNALQLRRQPPNFHDPRAVEVFWHDRKLGYLPRLVNAAGASLLDRAHKLRARMLGIDDPEEAWEPVRLRVWVDIVKPV